MATKVISAFFTNNGVPQTGLSPTIDIWQVIVSPYSAPQIIFSAPLVEVGGGWYVYLFTSYTFDFNYLFTIDGTATLTGSDRYKFGGNESYEEDISFEVWEEPPGNHIAPSTMGFIMTFMRKMLTNRNRIDNATNTLTVYEDDRLTPLIVFDLKDFSEAPSINPIADRVPQ